MKKTNRNTSNKIHCEHNDIFSTKRVTGKFHVEEMYKKVCCTCKVVAVVVVVFFFLLIRPRVMALD